MRMYPTSTSVEKQKDHQPVLRGQQVIAIHFELATGRETQVLSLQAAQVLMNQLREKLPK